jgi:tetratricopeptide (TPR) repeat protein
VAVLDERVIVCKVDRKPQGEARQQVEIDARNLWQRLQDIVLRLTEQYRQLASLPKAVQYREALAKVTANLEVLDAELNTLTLELGRVRREGHRVAANVEPLLGQCDRYLKEIRKRRDTLLKARDELEDVVKTEDSPEAKEKRETYVTLLQRAEALREDAEFEKVIETYEEILRQFGDRAEVRRRLVELKAAWELKGEEHRKARTFVYGAWAGLKTYEDVRDNLPKARQAFEVCRGVGDRLTATKLFLVASTTATNLVLQRAEELGQSQSDGDEINLKQVQAVGSELQALVKDLQAFVPPEPEKKD